MRCQTIWRMSALNSTWRHITLTKHLHNLGCISGVKS